MQVIIFGTGQLYQQMKDRLRNDIEILAFIDNNPSKWGEKLNGIEIKSPQDITNMEYDFVFTLSIYQKEMYNQLINMGVPRERIYNTYHIEKICRCKPAVFWGKLSTNSETKKILIYSHALISTGAQNVLFTLIQVLHKNGYHVAVVSQTDGILRHRIQELDIPVIIMEDSYFEEDTFTKLLNWADKIIVNTLWLFYIVEELRLYDKPVLWWIHETGIVTELGKNFFERISESRSISTYAVSSLVKRKILCEIGSDALNIKILMFGVPYYESVPKEIFFREKDIFAVIGWIGKEKGQDIFLDAIERLPDKYRNKAEFWIVGKGELAREEMKRADVLQCVKIIGEIDNQRMPELYSQIDVVVCCSRQEAMSVVVTEGCMTGRLVIVSSAAGITDLITNGENGLIFQSEEVEQLVELLKWTIDHREQVRIMGQSAMKIYENYFSMDIFEENILSIVED